MQWYSIDRIEGKFAVIEADDKSVKNITLSELPVGIKEGDVLAFENGEYYVDIQETQRRKDLAIKLQKKLFKK